MQPTVPSLVILSTTLSRLWEQQCLGQWRWLVFHKNLSCYLTVEPRNLRPFSPFSPNYMLSYNTIITRRDSLPAYFTITSRYILTSLYMLYLCLEEFPSNQANVFHLHFATLDCVIICTQYTWWGVTQGQGKELGGVGGGWLVLSEWYPSCLRDPPQELWKSSCPHKSHPGPFSRLGLRAAICSSSDSMNFLPPGVRLPQGWYNSPQRPQ